MLTLEQAYARIDALTPEALAAAHDRGLWWLREQEDSGAAWLDAGRTVEDPDYTFNYKRWARIDARRCSLAVTP